MIKRGISCLRPLSRIHAPRTIVLQPHEGSPRFVSQTSVEDSRPTDPCTNPGYPTEDRSQTSVEDSRPTDLVTGLTEAQNAKSQTSVEDSRPTDG